MVFSCTDRKKKRKEEREQASKQVSKNVWLLLLFLIYRIFGPIQYMQFFALCNFLLLSFLNAATSIFMEGYEIDVSVFVQEKSKQPQY